MFQEEGYRMMGAAFEVYNESGYGMAEDIYQQSLEIELDLRSIPFRRKHELSVYYKGKLLETRYKPDLFVHEGIVVELKAVPRSAAVQLHAHCPATRRVFPQLRPQRRTGMETVHTVRFEEDRNKGTLIGTDSH